MEGYNKVDYCLGDKVMSTIYFNYKTEDVICENFTDNIFDCAMLSGKHTWDELLEFMEERTFPHTRANVKSLISHLGLQYYDALEIAMITHGVQCDDDFYLKFDDEEVNYDDISARVGPCYGQGCYKSTDNI